MCELKVSSHAPARIPTPEGEFHLSLYTNSQDEDKHLALSMGDVRGGENVLVRVHSECFTGDVLGSSRCDCGQQLTSSLQAIAAEGRGLLIYLPQEGRGIGLQDKLLAYNLQDQGYDTVDANLLLGHQADERDYTMAACMLEDLGIQSVRLLTNNPNKIADLRALGVIIAGRIPLPTKVTKENESYLRTKALRFNHRITFSPEENGNRVPPSNGYERSI